MTPSILFCDFLLCNVAQLVNKLRSASKKKYENSAAAVTVTLTFTSLNKMYDLKTPNDI